ncbi:MAG TPA: CmcJ/NvfI family oxidoreductase [Vitreimonas sp.]|nr:CmcJ/NvfI family oxidoreductase [Vitreimonas sp.]
MSLDILERPKDRTVEASLLFIEPAGTKPEVAFGYESGVAETNALYTPRKVMLQDARRTLPYLDAEGFALLRHRSAVGDFWDDAEAESVGRAEAAELVAQATGAKRVHVFDHTQRRRSPDARRQPSTRVHVDYTLKSAPRRVRDLFGAEADDLLARRYAFINVWRPISHRAEDWPLALADARSVAPGELVATDIVYPDRRGEIYNLTYSPRHRWWYVPDMGLDEALLIKCYDSREDVARFTPHTAFENPLTRPGAPPRESIEFRTIAFFD